MSDVVDEDLFFRWAVENLVAFGMPFEHALMLSQAAVRQMRNPACGDYLGNLVCDMELMKRGQFPLEPEYDTLRLCEWAIEIRQVGGRVEFALAASEDFATHAAITQGHAAVLLPAPVSIHQVSDQLERHAANGFAALAMEFQKEPEACRLFWTLPSSNGVLFVHERNSGLTSRHGTALADLCRLIGIPSKIPVALNVPAAAGMGILVLHSEQLQANVRSAFKQDSSSDLTTRTTTRKGQVAIRSLLKTKMRLMSATQQTFDPFQQP